jgi:hypothetical protein
VVDLNYAYLAVQETMFKEVQMHVCEQSGFLKTRRRAKAGIAL